LFEPNIIVRFSFQSQKAKLKGYLVLCRLPPHPAPRNSLTESYSWTNIDIVSSNLGVTHCYHIKHKRSRLGGPDRL